MGELAHGRGLWRFLEVTAHGLWIGGDAQNWEVGSEVGSRR